MSKPRAAPLFSNDNCTAPSNTIRHYSLLIICLNGNIAFAIWFWLCLDDSSSILRRISQFRLDMLKLKGKVEREREKVKLWIHSFRPKIASMPTKIIKWNELIYFHFAIHTNTLMQFPIEYFCIKIYTFVIWTDTKEALKMLSSQHSVLFFSIHLLRFIDVSLFLFENCQKFIIVIQLPICVMISFQLCGCIFFRVEKIVNYFTALNRKSSQQLAAVFLCLNQAKQLWHNSQ